MERAVAKKKKKNEWCRRLRNYRKMYGIKLVQVFQGGKHPPWRQNNVKVTFYWLKRLNKAQEFFHCRQNFVLQKALSIDTFINVDLVNRYWKIQEEMAQNIAKFWLILVHSNSLIFTIHQRSGNFTFSYILSDRFMFCSSIQKYFRPNLCFQR